MVKFGVKTVEEALKLGKEAAARVTKIFPSPISLEFEKVYYPYLLMAKKRYAGLYWTRADKYDKLDCKGIETVRRDNCQLVRSMIDVCLRKIIIDRDVQGAVDHAKHQISNLLQNKVDISMLVITKSLSREASDYANKQPHVELAEKLRKRDPGSAPVVGDRVPYVIIQAAKGTPVCQKSEDPLYVLENSIPIDTKYYMEQQLSKPLLRLFEAILPDPTILLTGDHTRKVFKATAATAGLMRFGWETTKKCVGCRVPLPKNRTEEALCAGCEPKRLAIYMEKLAISKTKQVEFNKLWVQCQRCTGTLVRGVDCASMDCPIFYRRMRARKDVNEIEEVLSRF